MLNSSVTEKVVTVEGKNEHPLLYKKMYNYFTIYAILPHVSISRPDLNKAVYDIISERIFWCMGSKYYTCKRD